MSTSIPDYVTPGKSLLMFVSVQNTSNAPLNGNVSVKYDFPLGVVPAEAQAGTLEDFPISCTIAGQAMECEAGDGLESGREIILRTISAVEGGAEGVLSGQITVSGGGTGEELTEPISLDTDPIQAFAVRSFGVSMSSGPAYPSTQAGVGIAQLDTEIHFSSSTEANLGLPFPGFIGNSPTESFRNVIVQVPPGFIGNPTATSLRCTSAELVTKTMISGVGTTIPACPAASQVGLVQLNIGAIVPLYNIVPPVGSPAMFGFVYNGVVITLKAKVRPSDNGIDIVSEESPSSVPIPSFEVSLWGVPADSSHDQLRTTCLLGEAGHNPSFCDIGDVGAPQPFLRTPTSCTGSPLTWSIDVDSYQHPETYVHSKTTTPATEGCEKLPFDPSIALTPNSHVALQPSGLDVNLKLPQENGPDGLAEADLKSATVTLPEGLALNPASADGLEACSDAQVRLGLEGPSDCPDASRLGTVEVKTPLLEEPLGGSVFLRSQASGDPASGDLYRLAIELRSDDRGLAIRLPGSLKADPGTGQLTASFSDLPQLPFDSMQLHFNSGPRAPLTTPETCGNYTTHASLTSWSGRTVPFESSFDVDQGCTLSPFAPDFQAGVEDSTAGAFSPFNLRVTRGDGQPNISRIDTTLPRGELAKLAGVPLCPEADAATGACPASSRIGATTVGAGNGPSPLYLPQPGKSPTAVYLAGSYKSAPYSLVVRVPAQAGPFDLGTVAVRSALQVNPETTQVSVASDPLPQIIAGVPVAYRDVRVSADRPGFTLNPTSCEPQVVAGEIASVGGGSAAVSARFQVHDCAALAFKPHLSIALRGKTARTGHPALTAVLRMPQKGPSANIARTSVSLPHSEFLAQEHIDTVCTRVQYAAGAGGGAQCPKGSVYGHARAFTPLLDRPLEGPVYLRSNGGDRELPDLVASLEGQIHVDLVGYIDADKTTGGLRATFAKVPDAPVSRFVLKLPGGKKSLLENSTDICRGRHRAIVKMDGQNGRLHDFRPALRVKCARKKA